MAAAAIAAVSSVASGFMGMQQSAYQAKVANMNAQIAEENAKRALERSRIEQEDSDRFQTAAMLGEQEAAQSTSGLSLTGKSAILTRATARKLGRRDALNIIQAGEIESYNYRTQAANFRADAGAARLSGVSSLLGGFIGAAGGFADRMPSSLMSGASATRRRFAPYPVAKPYGLVY